MLGQGLLLPRFEWVVQQLLHAAVLGAMALLVRCCHVPVGLGVSPLRRAGLLRCASSHRGTVVSALTGFHP